jgi:type IV pilus assembly protein PilY1
MRIKTYWFAAACAVLAATSGYGQAVISSTAGGNTVYLGVNTLGHLNVGGGVSVNAGGVTGIAFESAATSAIGVGLGRAAGAYDATSPGCFCEGWGVSASGISGFNGNGSGGLALVSFATDDPGGPSPVGPHGTFATSTTRLTGFGVATPLTVEQAYTVDVPGALFKNTVTITNNTGATVTDLRYVRVMDWDVPFTEFAEHVSIVGATANLIPAPGGFLELSHDDGFDTANPLAATGAILGGTTNTDFIDSGPADHGAYFKFNFGSLDDGDSFTFSVYYGAAPSEAAMLTAFSLASDPINLFSLGQSRTPSGNPALGTPITYGFGFSGVGDIIVVPPPGGVPEPATVAVWGGLLAMGGIVAWRRKLQAQRETA